MLTYSVRRPASAAAGGKAATANHDASRRGGGGGGGGLARRPASAAPRGQTTAGGTMSTAGGSAAQGRPASARPASAGGARKTAVAMGGLVSRTWELAMEQQSGGRPGSGGMLALGKSGRVSADTHSLLDSFVQEAAASSARGRPASAAGTSGGSSCDGLGQRGRPVSAAGTSALGSRDRTFASGGGSESGSGSSRASLSIHVAGGGSVGVERVPLELDESLASRSAFSLDVSAARSSGTTTMTMSAGAERARRRQQRSRRQAASSRRPASAGSLRAAVGTWGEQRNRSVGLSQLTRSSGGQAGRSGSSGCGGSSRGKSAWEWEDNLAALQRQSGRFAGAGITLG